MGQDQPTSPPVAHASGGRSLRPRVCLRKGCGCVFQPKRWNQRYCQDSQCLRLVRRWQAAKRQRQYRQNAETRQRHCQAERLRRKRCREQASHEAASRPVAAEPTNGSENPRAWSRSKRSAEDFCDRPGCYDPLRPARCTKARYCGDDCRQAIGRVLDRERKWFSRKTSVGRFKRRLEYERARRKRAAKPQAPIRSTRSAGVQAPPRDGGRPSCGRELFGFT